jgi:putative holliday junction resolvase
MRLLGVDFGFKRIGLAAGEAGLGLFSAKPTLDASGSLARDAVRIADAARKEQADVVVVGLPVELSGEEGRMARICRQLGELIAAEGLDVQWVDEGMSSVVAENHLFDAGLKASQRRKKRDGEAAILILERYVSEKTTP